MQRSDDATTPTTTITRTSRTTINGQLNADKNNQQHAANVSLVAGLKESDRPSFFYPIPLPRFSTLKSSFAIEIPAFP
jgi:hypothetical protein